MSFPLMQPTPIRYKMAPAQFSAPSPSSSPALAQSPKNPALYISTSQDLISGINASLLSSSSPSPLGSESSSSGCRAATPHHHIFADDYTVPAPPPPSPVSFRPDCWPKPAQP